MTYLELYHKAERLLDDNKITLGEYEKMIEPLNAEIAEWIPVSERLPEVKTDVLVYNDAGGMPMVDVDSMGHYEYVDASFWYRSQNVTHWMPLPCPPKTKVNYRVVEDVEVGEDKYERRILLDNTDADSCWDFLQKLPAERHKNVKITPCMAE